MANSAMVSSITLNVDSASHNSSQSTHIVTRHSGGKAPFAGRQQTTMVAWKVSGKPWTVRECQNSLQHFSQTPEGQGQYLITNRPGESGLAGVMNKRLISLQVIISGISL